MKKEKKILLNFFPCFVLFFTYEYFREEIILLNYNLEVIFLLVPNCPFYYVGAKLSWCQIVRCQIALVPNCPGAKLSWCQIVRCQIVLPPCDIVLYKVHIVHCDHGD